jgi:guanosine-3',5'-bis(diphosphate) 3'-pyrophosphohydrolase
MTRTSIKKQNIKLEPCEYSKSFIDKIHELNKMAANYKCSTVDVSFIEKGIAFAKYYHGSQIRKSGEPYYSHPIIVAEMTANHIFKSDAIIAALLHDTVEDTMLTLGEIEYEFSPRIAEMVERLTRIKDGLKISVNEIATKLCESNDKESILVKLLDRKHNLITIEFLSKEKQMKIIKETIEELFILSVYIEEKSIVKEIKQLCSEKFAKQDYSNFVGRLRDGFYYPSLDLQNELLRTLNQEVQELTRL